MNTEQYKQDIQVAFEADMQAIEQAWGFRPDVTLLVEPCLKVKADFNIAGFAHKGRIAYVTDASAKGRRKPKNVAREVAREIVGHRGTCDECGTGPPSIFIRARDWSMIPFYAKKYGDRMHAPPDAAEKRMFPGISRRLEARLKAKP